MTPKRTDVAVVGAGIWGLSACHFLRRLAPRPARRLRRAHRGRVLLAGIVVVFIMTIPVVNLIAPVLATAFMVHVFQNLPRRRGFMAAEAAGVGAPSEIA